MKSRVRRLSILVGSCFVLAGFAIAEQSAKPDTAKPGADKPFADVIKDYREIPGLFTLYFKADENKVLMEIKPDQIDSVFLCSTTREAGDGRYFDSGAQLDNFPFVFKRIGKKIQFIHRNVYFRADSKAPMSRAIGRGVTSSVLGSAKIESAPHPVRKSILIDPTTLFVQDYGMVSASLQEWLKVDFSLDRDNSYFSELKSFPGNTEIEVTLTFSTQHPKAGFGPIADTRSIQHRYHYSLSALPLSDYRPRLADDRVGHFLTMYKDYTDGTEDTPYRRYINRWNLQKKDSSAAISEPREPIVFWLENTIPTQYRDAVRKGILLWNDAFERIGFRNAIVVKQQPDSADWDPADVRYNTIRWILMPDGGYAVGPSRTNPFTGQIYDADIRVSADIVRYTQKEYEEYVEPLSSPAGEGSLAAPDNPFACTYARGLLKQASFGWGLLEARGLLEGNDSLKQKYVNDYIISLIVHEVGHTLGLRHNFRASTTHSASELQNDSLTIREGVTGSVMDYIPVNLALKGEHQGQYWQTTLGTYDYWAIEYAYRPINEASPEGELPELAKIAARVSDPKLAYGTDEDAFGFAPQGIDPVTNMFDLGNDPLAYFRTRVKLAQELWGSIEEKFGKPGTRYQKLLRVFDQGFNDFYLGGLTASKFIGGIYHRRDHIGDPGNRLPYEPVAPAKQREALEFLRTYIFGPDAFQFSPTLLNKLAIERLEDFEFSAFQVQRNDFPIHDVILSIQAQPLARLYNPLTLSRLVDLELRYGAGQGKFTLADMFKGIREAVWSEVQSGKPVNSFRRGLQRLHLAKLTSLVSAPSRGTPEDAATLARADLVALKGAISAALRGNTDPMTRAHFEESLARIDAALKVSLQRTVVPPM
ncbi:MAG TPA: zinc-dependent metalloprotease [Bacteroidota bacterium]|nr:zinc-dependent metalloprotease [Bacteroidota bacterium]